MNQEKNAWQTKKKDGIVIHRCGKVKPERGEMRACHSAKGAADPEKTVSRADASEKL